MMGYTLGIVGVIIVFFLVWMVIDNNRLKKILENLPDDVKTRLAIINIEKSNEEKLAWTQDAYIYDVVEKGNKVAIVFLWHNKVIQNNFYDKIEHADCKMKKTEFDMLGIKKGDFVRAYIDAKNSKTKIISKI